MHLKDLTSFTSGIFPWDTAMVKYKQTNKQNTSHQQNAG